MDRASDYRRFVTWAGGTASTTVQVSLGGLGAVACQAMPTLGLLRVGYQGAWPAQPCVGWVKPADGGTVIGDALSPIDVPFALVCEQPVTVFLAPVGPVISAITLFISVTPVGAPSDRLYATRTVLGVPGTPIVLPQWVRGVSAILPSTFSWLDRSGAAIGAIQTGAHDRPASAVAVMPIVGGPISLYY